MIPSNDDPDRAPDRRVGGRLVGDLLDEYRPRLRRMVTLRLDPRIRPRVDASDVVQEALVEVTRRIHDYREKGGMPFFLWVRQIAFQRLIDLHREHMGAAKRDVRKEMRVTGPGLNSSIALAHALTRDSSSPASRAERVEQQERLRDALEGMNEIDREILLLRYFEGLAFEHCGLTLGISTAAAKMRHLRALDRLGELLRQIGRDFGFSPPAP